MRETRHLFRSEILGNERAIWIRRPPENEASACPRLVVVLDAELYRERVEAVAVIEALEADRAIAPAWFVFVSVSSWEAR